MEIANLAGFSQAGTPVMVLGSRKIPATESANTGSIKKDTAVKALLPLQNLLNCSIEVDYVNIVNLNVDYVNRKILLHTGNLLPTTSKRPYHRGNLRESIIGESL